MTMEFSAVRFRSLSVEGFRRLERVRMDLRPLCVLIGANGVGKTSLLDVIHLLASSAQGRLAATVSEMGGLGPLLTCDRAESLQFGVAMEVPGHAPLEYSVSLRPRGVAYAIDTEHLSQVRKQFANPFRHIDSNAEHIRYFDSEQRKLVSPTWEHDPLETSLAQVPKMFREPEEFRARLASSSFYHVLDVHPRAPVRMPQPMQPAKLPGKNGEDLVSCLFYMRETDRPRFDAVEDALRAAFPRFDRLEFPPVAAGTLALAWREQGFSKPLYMHQLSEGTLRFLWMVTLLQSPGLTALTLIDEPGVSLHPELLLLLADLLREASQRTQLVVATHSDRLIRFLHPAEVALFDANESGLTEVRWADELDLDAWLEDYSLDELWKNGRLGARA